MQNKLDFLLERVQKQNPQANIRKIRAAYECAAKAHEGQKRKNGEPYIIHPVSVAEIVVEMGLDTDSICAALLHDVGKPACMLKDGNFHDHPARGAAIAADILTRLKAPKKLTEETAALVALDLSGRAYLAFEDKLDGKAGVFDLELVEEFLRAFSSHAGLNLYVKLLRRGNKHHEAEAVFKALALCLKDAAAVVSDRIPSSKGVLE